MEVLALQLTELAFSYSEFEKDARRNKPSVEETKVEEPVEVVPEPVVAEEPKIDVEALKSKAFAEGQATGEKTGYTNGSKSGYSKGFSAGLTEGSVKGKEEGIAQGKQEATQSVPQHNVKDIETLGNFFALNLLLNNSMQLVPTVNISEILGNEVFMAFRHTETYLKALGPEFSFASVSGSITNILRNVVEKSDHFAGPNVTFKQMIASLEEASTSGVLST